MSPPSASRSEQRPVAPGFRIRQGRAFCPPTNWLKDRPVAFGVADWSQAPKIRIPMPFDRPANLAHLRENPEVPVLIAGGGINGAGVLRELALQGIDAVLIDRADFASGATCASSRMIHGGLRYLENGEFRLVREALQERNRLLRLAPHCVRPLPTVIPLFARASGFANAALRFIGLSSRPTRRGEWLVRAGLALYERFAGADHGLPGHRIESGDQARRDRPLLHPGALAIATYFDAWNPLPERLCLEVIDDATRLHPGARAINYLALTGTGASNDPRVVVVRDLISREEIQIRPRVVVNATGAWIDRANASLESPSNWIGGTKGSHLVVDHPELFAQLGGSEIFYENADGRICLILPLNGRILVGTTDIRVDNPDEATCDQTEVDYLVAAVRQIFPAIRLEGNHILARFTGVRPLPRSGRSLTGRISRDHCLRETPPSTARMYPVLSLIGGKWTTFRAFAEVAVDRVLSLLEQPRRADSRDLPIGGGRNYPAGASARDLWIARHSARTGVDRMILAALFERHGTRASEVATHLGRMSGEGWRTIGPCFAGEIDWIVRNEAVVCLEDLVLRRTPLALFGHLDRARLDYAARLVAPALGWDEARTRQEIDRCAALLESRHGIDLDRTDLVPHRRR